MRPLPRQGWMRAMLLAAGLLATGCRPAPSDGAPVLRVADQLNFAQSALLAAGEDKPTTYRIAWSNFTAGPPIIAAETGGSVDLGWMAETPLVFAQAAGSPVKVVAVAGGTQAATSNIALVVAANSPIRRIADLRGRKVGYVPGTVAQYLVVRALAGAGLAPDAITPVRIDSFNTAILDRGVVDALVSAEPLLSEGLATGKIRVLAYGGQPYTPGFTYLVASEAALADPKRAALIGEFVQRLARATRRNHEDVARAAPIIAKAYRVTPERAAQIMRRTPTRYAPIDAAVIAAHQEEADLFHKLGFIQRRVDAAQLFDHRYDTLLPQAEARP